MQPFKYTQAKTAAVAVQSAKANIHARYLAGGTNLVDLMKEAVEQPDELIDINGLPLAAVSTLATGGISIGAMGKNTVAANHPLVRKSYPLLSQAILAGASVQIRNMASNGGNLLQRTRCPYFYDVAMPCNKRAPGTGCGAMEGYNKLHAIFGWSEQCIAVHPSDMCIALAALDAVVKVQDTNGKTRNIDFADFHRLPGDQPQLDNTLNPGDLITHIELPKNNFAAHSYYLKVRDRASYAFAMVSVAAAMDIKNGMIQQAKIALGGVAHKPWRAVEAEAFLAGKAATEENFRQAAALTMQKAKPLEGNTFKVELTTRAIVHALLKAGRGIKASI